VNQPDMQARLADAEREARRLRAIIEACPDVRDEKYYGLVSKALDLATCDMVAVRRNDSGDDTIRIGRDFDGQVVWAEPVPAEDLLMALLAHPTGGPAIVEVFDALRKAEGA
jgi:hypothetical protein